VAFLSQSGGHCNWYTHNGPNYGVRFSKAISFGNAYVLDSTDYLEYLATDVETGIICMYLEGIKDGRKLLRQVRDINRTKPVILWKAGLTESGSQAVASHTASLAGQEAVWRGFFAQTGAVAVNSLEEMAEMAMTFLYVKSPAGKRVGVVVLGGGSSVASADICSRQGMETPALLPETQAELKKFINIAGASVRNPLDTGHVFRDITLLQREIDLVTADPNIDMLIVRPHLDMVRAAGPDQLDRTIDYLSSICRDNPNGKPAVLVFHTFSNDPWERELRARLQTELPGRGVPVYGSLEAACRSLDRLYRYHRFQAETAAPGGAAESAAAGV
jgi:acyl-CoA synthetase (NDP forming)